MVATLSSASVIVPVPLRCAANATKGSAAELSTRSSSPGVSCTVSQSRQAEFLITTSPLNIDSLLTSPFSFLDDTTEFVGHTCLSTPTDDQKGRTSKCLL